VSLIASPISKPRPFPRRHQHRNKAIKPLLAAAQELRPARGPQNPRALDEHSESIRTAMQGIFQELGWPHKDRQFFFRGSPLSA
jgi:hypothetical protein